MGEQEKEETKQLSEKFVSNSELSQRWNLFVPVVLILLPYLKLILMLFFKEIWRSFWGSLGMTPKISMQCSLVSQVFVDTAELPVY